MGFALALAFFAFVEAGGDDVVADEEGDFAIADGDGFGADVWGEVVEGEVAFDDGEHLRVSFVGEDVLDAADFRADKADEADAAADFQDAVAAAEGFADEDALRFFVCFLEEAVAHLAADGAEFGGDGDAVDDDGFGVEKAADSFRRLRMGELMLGAGWRKVSGRRR